MFTLPSSRTLLRPIPLARHLRPWARSASRKSNPWPEIQGTAGDQPKIRTWVAPASRIANFLIVPTAILYAVFFADFGDHEHVFSPPRRWLESQKSVFFSLSPEEQKLAGVDAAKHDPPAVVQGSGPSQCTFRIAITITWHYFLRQTQVLKMVASDEGRPELYMAGW